jgi:hypothetical protein
MNVVKLEIIVERRRDNVQHRNNRFSSHATISNHKCEFRSVEEGGVARNEAVLVKLAPGTILEKGAALVDGLSFLRLRSCFEKISSW